LETQIGRMIIKGELQDHHTLVIDEEEGALVFRR
jgi:hypothetical protein